MSTKPLWIGTYLSSSVGKKQLMGITGLMLCGFLFAHVLGNFLIFVGPDAFNMYSYKLTSNPLIYVAEAGLAAIFLLHLGLAINLTAGNKKARPVSYHKKVKTGRGATFASSTMPFTGIIAALFIGKHIYDFKLETLKPTAPMTTVSGIEMIDIYRIVMDYFANNPWGVLIYVVGVAAIGIHVSHGFSSAFQSIGFNHPKYTPIFKKSGLAFAAFITLAFATFPIWSFITGGVQ